ncbi:hypothetical protein FNB79_17055 [Formosa sediminum]|uniref:Lysoplasmalogenase n=1 Tax=Formosa sediminum TaxID=2594004 RepID=A0A516GVS9_9FLAO|nr:hypothetical protein [Formosa sediminum]QDO95606.1 hypothetical protein FNB79_17055 [Formosa sediminum]
MRCNYINWYLATYLISAFLADLTSIFFHHPKILMYCNLFYLVSYLSLLGFVLTKFKGIRFGMLLGVYLVVVFVINTYLLYQLYTVLDGIIKNPIMVMFFGLHTVTLVILAFVSFAVYLNSDTKSSILYLVMALCFIFSKVLFYIRNYYIYDWSLVLIELFLYSGGLIFLFYYMVNKNKAKKRAQKIRSYNFVFAKQKEQQQVLKQ